MKKVLIGVMLTIGVTGLAHAAGDKNAGKEKAAVCGACHGPTGVSAADNFPNLAGQGERYLIKQITDIKSKERVVLEMTGMTDNLSEQDIADIAAFYASQPAPLSVVPKNKVEPKDSKGAVDLKLAERLYRAGDLKKGVPACAACHMPTGKGNDHAGFPRLSGQHAKYIAKQLTDFREGDRINDGDNKIMRAIAEKLSNKEIQALSYYVQGLYK
ncbi:c-type cytochrome [Spartinivicinus poritis]|uniref:C-type cytochrome n=1 Tax=Spartinivicinus poritis TaxID=2994640 RepID=A0ABT5UDJ7_9GAMM|nr:c-type cytochrome [Spartinivicinus sp. A2-2]MDE1463587.1 c-type cytochrome [Spartinivicinus sp. A2-2]